jgi:activator of HSP90 ATPase
MTDWKNVNNWHWSEKDYFEKTKEFFDDKVGITLGEMSKTKVIKFSNFDGMVTVNIRKGKIIPVFDFKTTMSFIINEVEYDLVLELDSSTKNILCTNFRNTNLSEKSILDLEKISQEFNQFLIDAASNDFSVEKNSTPSCPNYVKTEFNQISTQSSFTGTEFSEKWRFFCPKELIIQMLANPPFGLKEGYFNIHNLILYKIEKSSEDVILLKWKLEQWNECSHVKISMALKSSGITTLTLHQTNIPSDFIYSASENWETYFWKPLSLIHGFSFEKEICN